MINRETYTGNTRRLGVVKNQRRKVTREYDSRP